MQTFVFRFSFLFLLKGGVVFREVGGWWQKEGERGFVLVVVCRGFEASDVF